MTATDAYYIKLGTGRKGRFALRAKAPTLSSPARSR
jgi:hypothetical protein